MTPSEDRAERLRIVKSMTLAGYPRDKIADRAGCSPRQVTRDRHALGISQRPPNAPLTDQQLAFAQQLLDDGCSRAEVARTLGVYESTIRRRFPNHKWTPAQVADYIATLEQDRPRRRRG